MSTTEHDDLEQKLAAMTRWEGQAPGLWRKALDKGRRGVGPSVWRIPYRLRLAAIVAVGLVAVSAALVLLPNLGRQHDLFHASMNAKELARSPRSVDMSIGWGSDGVTDVDRVLAQRVNPTGVLDIQNGAVGLGGGRRGPITIQPEPGSAPIAADRHVVRKATLELVTPDVEATFLKATQVPSAARGEFIESSKLAGSGAAARASLTLRVDAVRLSETLTALRALGLVQSEELHGEDVTGQVVDLEARLRNEQRVETELLELLQSRADAPLDDILELRRRIGQVRESIERLTAQRERVRGLVRLATVLVIIRADDAPPEAKQESGLGEYFRQSLGDAWTSGLRYLTDTLSGAVRVLLGGMLIWAALAAGIVIWRNRRRQASAAV